jgi:hypothetical protein
MLPLLALDPSAATGPATKRQKTAGVIYFKAYKKGQFRQLSNLFGPVEWEFQAAKFKQGSGVNEWLIANSMKEWSVEEFDTVRKVMKHDGKLASYVAEDGTVASGLLAQMCSLIVRNPASPDARKRLSFILGKGQTTMPVSEAEAWVRDNVNPELSDTNKDALLLELLRKKFTIPKYHSLLLSTGSVVLHEARGRGAPNRYEFHPLTESQRSENDSLVVEGLAPKWSEGGDALGKLMMIVRAELL